MFCQYHQCSFDTLMSGAYMFSMITGMQIKMARVALNWSARDLAKNAEVHPNTIRRAEADNQTVTKGTLLILEDALETAGIEFIEQDGGGPGVRLRDRQG